MAQTPPPSLVLTKTGVLDLGADGLATPGDLISYTFQVDNQDQECFLADLGLSDPLISPITCPSGNPIPSLAVGLSETCTGSYVITQADIDAGQVVNQATASGLACRQGPVVEAMASHTQTIPQESGIGLGKSGVLGLGADTVATGGDLITYSLAITNTGNVTLTDVTLTDTVLASFSCPSGHPIPSLAPGAAETCTGTYAITQADIDLGQKENTAEVVADEPPPPTTAPASRAANQAMATVVIPQQPAIEIDKSGTAELGADGIADPGDLVNYSLLVSNTGNVTLTNVSVTDPLIAAISCPNGNPVPTLPPAGSENCTGSYALTAADIAAASVVNSADASGTDPMMQPVTGSDSDTVTLPVAMPTTGTVGLLALALALVAGGLRVLRRGRAVR